MDTIVWIYWAISLTIVTYISTQIVKKYNELGFAALTGFYTIYLAMSQIFAARIIEFNIFTYQFFVPAAVFLYPFIAQVIDMINEVYGRERTHIAIFIAFVTQVLLVVFILLVGSLQPAPFFFYEEAWQNIFSLSIRVTIASWVAFLLSSNLDAFVFAKLKERFSKRESKFNRDMFVNPYLWLRSSVSDFSNLTLDSIIFIIIAFYGVLPVTPLIIGQVILKNIIGFVDNPWFVWYKRMLVKERDFSEKSNSTSLSNIVN